MKTEVEKTRKRKLKDHKQIFDIQQLACMGLNADI